MPGPDPDGLYFEVYEGRWIVSYFPYFWSGNEGHRKARAIALLRRKVRGDWRCGWCWKELPIWRRVDARFCGEGCRKKAARERRLVRS